MKNIKKERIDLFKFVACKVFDLSDVVDFPNRFSIDGNKIYDFKEKGYSLIVDSGKNEFKIFDYNSEDLFEIKMDKKNRVELVGFGQII